MNFFNENQRGAAAGIAEAGIGRSVNRTEALDASRAAVRDEKLVAAASLSP